MVALIEIEGHPVKKLLGLAEENVQKKTVDSRVLDIEAEARIPKFMSSELTIGRVLGRGGFCVVSEVTRITLQKAVSNGGGTSNNNSSSQKMNDESDIHNIVQDRDFMEAHCIRNGKDYRYAIKRLHEKSTKDAQQFMNGVIDLSIEARFLSVVRHPNIIKMRAMAMGSPYDTDFFVVLDRLYDIMPQRITKWKKERPAGIGKMMDRGGKKALAHFLIRITVAYDIACALKYLHDLCIVYRDLKPDNIGFDVRGDVKIFDLGLAREFDPTTMNKDGTYNMTGDTGSPRYMATEVALGKPYNANCDVYSFSILLWQMLALETPFDNFNMNMFKKFVIQGGTRPAPDPKWPKDIINLLRVGWGPAVTRPSMEHVCTCLRDEINRNSDESIGDMVDASRKSELSLRGGR